MPWLRDLPIIASSDTLHAAVLDRMGPCEEPCPDYGGIELRADVSDHPGTETIRASFTRGLLVVDEAGRVVGRRRSFESIGSADELVALAVGDARLATPVIAIAVRTGGRREHEVRLELARMIDGKLEILFSGVIEQHDNEGDATGSIAFVSGGVCYVAPRASGCELLALR
jgi:hypothetical protein